MFRGSIGFALCMVLTWAFPAPSRGEPLPLRDQASAAMKQAATYYRSEVASHGGYVYYYSANLQQRWGEGKATADMAFVQPPGTPTVGMAYLRAYAATGDKFYLEAAVETCEALVAGQLKSGGWTQVIHFTPPAEGRLGDYRHGKLAGKWNASSLDDDQTQAALELLMRTDEALQFRHAAIHEATEYGLNALLKAQFANGAFPQVWTGPVSAQPVLRAQFPTYDWKSEGRLKNYWDYYTLNDDSAGTVAHTLITAHTVYGDDRYQQSLRKLGDFLLLAQMPAPQPAWCQQYSYQMVPIWARKFEPPAIASSESVDVIQTLLRIAHYTGQPKYLQPLPAALEYLKSSQLTEGTMARYYELGTNRPLYMNAQYQLTYDDSTAPSHYGWKRSVKLPQLEKAYEAAKQGQDPFPVALPRKLNEVVPQIIKELDTQGRWVTNYSGERLVGQPKFATGFQYVSSERFAKNMVILSQYLESQE